jgi:hypothetical protein
MFRYTALTLGLWAAAIPGIDRGRDGDPQALLIEQSAYGGTKEKNRAAESWEKVLLLNASQPIALYGLREPCIEE